MKRFIDIVGAALGLVLLTPVMAVIALLIARNMGTPVLFRQVRTGLHGRLFTLLKFRTMRDAVDANGKPRPDHERMTRLGHFLRRTSLDELPEFWNVLRGEMSLVGPRPLLPEYLPLYSPEQRRRHEVRPGITGWAQVNGRNAISWDEKFQRDVWYVDHQSLLLDLRILWLTVLRVVRAEDISQPGCATAEKFAGSGTPMREVATPEGKR